jgi:hypothetical protein
MSSLRSVVEVTAPRLIATDLDGTIVRSDGTVSARTVAAFGRAIAAGAKLVLVTGRPPRWMREIATAIGQTGLAICANGAIVYDLDTERVVHSRQIEPDVLSLATTRLRAAMPDVAFAIEREDGFHCEPAYRTWADPTPPPTLSLTLPAVKLLALEPAYEPDALMRQAEHTVGGIVTVTRSSDRGLIEMSAHGVSKASALAGLCAELGVPAADVAAFGDMPNDVPMLSWAGRSYGVANAHPAVLAVVDHAVPSNDEDGVAATLEEFFP